MKRRAFVRSTLAAAMAAAVPYRRPLLAHFQAVSQDAPNVDAITGDGGQVTLSGSAITDLKNRLQGRLLLAQDEGYDDARMILNPSFDKRPALIAQPTGTADVRSAVDFAGENNLLLAVKCGGHSFSGKSTCDGGMMIDLSAFRDVRVDPVARTARVTGGSLLAQVDHEAMAYDLVTPMGTVSHTGVGGLVTGGGFGRLARRFGLAVDNMLSADVVTADGQFWRCSANENADLFWGIRGGGGNFGIVTSFEFRLHPMQRRVVGGQILFPIELARDILRFYAEYEARDDLTLDFMMVAPPGGAPAMVGFGVCYSGPESAAERVLALVRSLGTPIVDGVQGMDYVALQQSGDTTDPRARATYLKSGFYPELPNGLIDAIVDGFDPAPNRTTLVFVQQSGGAIGRVANDATAFSHRDAAGNLLAITDWAFGEDGSEHIASTRAYWANVEPFMQGFYTNDVTLEDTAETINANYRENYPRLVDIKNKYDPTNLFRLNANVQPTM
ncbi:MAG: FAD-binding oxidoreductase [Gemmatimonadetes bacterium]|nr:FAD-binding oxidoreductase [Gemmatimonadota bacterium]